MKDKQFKRILGEAFRNKETVIAFLNSQKAEDVERGNFFLSEEFINGTLRQTLISLAAPHLRNYRINFQGGTITIFAEVNTKQLGMLSLIYELKVIDFSFGPGGHNLTVAYREEVEPKGSALQVTMFKTMGMHKHFLKTALGFLKADYLKTAAGVLSINLDKAPFASRIPQWLTLAYKDSKDGMLHLSL